MLSGDLVRLVAVFNAAKMIDGQLAKLISTTGDNMEAARQYFAMHAALFAMLVHAQDATIAKIDTQYLPKLDAIITDIAAARGRTAELTEGREPARSEARARGQPRQPEACRRRGARPTAATCSSSASRSRRRASRPSHDLSIADNTYETVEASVQLRNLMRDSSASFEAIQKLEAPTFDQIFKNEELRQEFENLTRKLDAPAS